MNPSVEKRPWGRFERFTLNEPCTVKLVYVDGDKRLSLQYHDNRSEFWKVVKGPVKVQIGQETITLQTGDSITVPKRRQFVGLSVQTDVIILQISVGGFDEEDIVRLEDDHSRVQYQRLCYEV